MYLDNPTAIRAEAKRRQWAAEKRRRQLERCRETAPITREERDGRIVEWRGQRCCGGGIPQRFC
ncbi:MAG: hypothetical protein ACI4RD_02990 [Kiritimatiellia bacterium]